MPGKTPRCAGVLCDTWVLFPTAYAGEERAVASPLVAECKEFYPLPLLKWSSEKGAGPALSVGSAKGHCQGKWSEAGIIV